MYYENVLKKLFPRAEDIIEDWEKRTITFTITSRLDVQGNPNYALVANIQIMNGFHNAFVGNTAKIGFPQIHLTAKPKEFCPEEVALIFEIRNVNFPERPSK